MDRVFFLLLGALLTWIIQQYRSVRSEEAALISEHIKDIEKFADSIAEYWLKIPANDDEEKSAAARVRARYSAIGLLYPTILKICSEDDEKYKKLCLDLYANGTGGDFEGKGRKSEPERAIENYLISANLIHYLRLVKVDLISFRRLVRLASSEIRNRLPSPSKRQ